MLVYGNGCFVNCVGYDPSKAKVSTQPQLTVLPQAHWILVCCIAWCIGEFMVVV